MDVCFSIQSSHFVNKCLFAPINVQQSGDWWPAVELQSSCDVILANVPTEEVTCVIVPAVTAGVQQRVALRTQLTSDLRSLSRKHGNV